MSSQPKIIVAGAGPAGLTFARLLQCHNIPVTIYEGEPDRHTRNQGGSLDLHPDGGQLALKEAGLTEEFNRLSRPEGECMKVMDGTGKVWMDENTSEFKRRDFESSRPEIDRTVLRDLLLDSLQPGTVQWGHRIERVEVQDTTKGTHAIHFKDGITVSDIDLLVGGDGAFSKVRPLVTDVQPEYSGITSIEQWKMNVAETNPWLSEYVGAGSNFMFDEGRALLAQRQGDGSVRCYTMVRKPYTWAYNDSGIDWNDQAAARKTLAEQYFGDCGADIKRAILSFDDHMILRHYYMLPIGLKWDSKKGVALLGDSAHVMTPFAGVGVNVAMADARSLARALIARKDMLSSEEERFAAIQEYDAEMFPRAEHNARKTYEGLQHHFRASGAEEWGKRFQGFVEKMKAAKATAKP